MGTHDPTADAVARARGARGADMAGHGATAAAVAAGAVAGAATGAAPATSTMLGRSEGNRGASAAGSAGAAARTSMSGAPGTPRGAAASVPLARRASGGPGFAEAAGAAPPGLLPLPPPSLIARYAPSGTLSRPASAAPLAVHGGTPSPEAGTTPTTPLSLCPESAALQPQAATTILPWGPATHSLSSQPSLAITAAAAAAVRAEAASAARAARNAATAARGSPESAGSAGDATGSRSASRGTLGGKLPRPSPRYRGAGGSAAATATAAGTTTASPEPRGDTVRVAGYVSTFSSPPVVASGAADSNNATATSGDSPTRAPRVLRVRRAVTVSDLRPLHELAPIPHLGRASADPRAAADSAAGVASSVISSAHVRPRGPPLAAPVALTTLRASRVYSEGPGALRGAASPSPSPTATARSGALRGPVALASPTCVPLRPSAAGRTSTAGPVTPPNGLLAATLGPQAASGGAAGGPPSVGAGTTRRTPSSEGAAGASPPPPAAMAAASHFGPQRPLMARRGDGTAVWTPGGSADGDAAADAARLRSSRSLHIAAATRGSCPPGDAVPEEIDAAPRARHARACSEGPAASHVYAHRRRAGETAPTAARGARAAARRDGGSGDGSSRQAAYVWAEGGGALYADGATRSSRSTAAAGAPRARGVATDVLESSSSGTPTPPHHSQAHPGDATTPRSGTIGAGNRRSLPPALSALGAAGDGSGMWNASLIGELAGDTRSDVGGGVSPLHSPPDGLVGTPLMRTSRVGGPAAARSVSQTPMSSQMSGSQWSCTELADGVVVGLPQRGGRPRGVYDGPHPQGGPLVGTVAPYMTGPGGQIGGMGPVVGMPVGMPMGMGSMNGLPIGRGWGFFVEGGMGGRGPPFGAPMW